MAMATLCSSPSNSEETPSAFMKVGSRTTQPPGHYQLCMADMTECRQTTPKKHKPVRLTAQFWASLLSVNDAVNREIRTESDMETWGEEEHWGYPDNGVGDDEEFALEKRRRLMKLGIAAGDLLLTVVKMPNADAHLVLTVRTDVADYILDNLRMGVLIWNESPYVFLKRQSEKSSGVWLSIADCDEDDENVRPCPVPAKGNP